METKITTTELEKNLADILDRVKRRGERFIVERDGEPVATLGPTAPVEGPTWAEFVELVSKLPRPDDRFADDLEAIQAAQSKQGPPEWDS